MKLNSNRVRLTLGAVLLLLVPYVSETIHASRSWKESKRLLQENGFSISEKALFAKKPEESGVNFLDELYISSCFSYSYDQSSELHHQREEDYRSLNSLLKKGRTKFETDWQINKKAGLNGLPEREISNTPAKDNLEAAQQNLIIQSIEEAITTSDISRFPANSERHLNPIRPALRDLRNLCTYFESRVLLALKEERNVVAIKYIRGILFLAGRVRQGTGSVTGYGASQKQMTQVQIRRFGCAAKEPENGQS